jgi:hypothetical protein
LFHNVRSWLADVLRLAVALPAVELRRYREGPGPLVARLRARGQRAFARSPAERERLRRIIAAVDARLPGQPSCYRRSLLEMALDKGAAFEPLSMGLRVPGGPRSGHAWLGVDPVAPSQPYDVQFDM